MAEASPCRLLLPSPVGVPACMWQPSLHCNHNGGGEGLGCDVRCRRHACAPATMPRDAPGIAPPPDLEPSAGFHQSPHTAAGVLLLHQRQHAPHPRRRVGAHDWPAEAAGAGPAQAGGSRAAGRRRRGLGGGRTSAMMPVEAAAACEARPASQPHRASPPHPACPRPAPSCAQQRWSREGATWAAARADNAVRRDFTVNGLLYDPFRWATSGGGGVVGAVGWGSCKAKGGAARLRRQRPALRPLQVRKMCA